MIQRIPSLYPQLNSLKGSPWDANSMGLGLRLVVATNGTNSWPTANKALFWPIVVDRDLVIKAFWTYNNSTASTAHFDIGIVRMADRALLKSTGAQARTGTAVIQTVSVTPIKIEAGNYLMAMSADSTGAGSGGGNIGSTALKLTILGAYEMATAYTLPSTVTPVAITGTFLPVAGFVEG